MIRCARIRLATLDGAAASGTAVVQDYCDKSTTTDWVLADKTYRSNAKSLQPILSSTGAVTSFSAEMTVPAAPNVSNGESVSLCTVVAPANSELCVSWGPFSHAPRTGAPTWWADAGRYDTNGLLDGSTGMALTPGAVVVFTSTLKDGTIYSTLELKGTGKQVTYQRDAMGGPLTAYFVFYGTGLTSQQFDNVAVSVANPDASLCVPYSLGGKSSIAGGTLSSDHRTCRYSKAILAP